MDPAVLLKEIIANLQAATDNGIRLIRRTVGMIATQPQLADELAAAPARRALQLAIWSDKSRIPRDEVELLGPLWMKYFEDQPGGDAASAACEPADGPSALVPSPGTPGEG